MTGRERQTDSPAGQVAHGAKTNRRGMSSNDGASRYGTSPYGASPYGTSPYGASPYGAGRGVRGWRVVATGVVAIAVVVAAVSGCGDGSGQSAGDPPPPEVTVVRPLQTEIVVWDKYTGRMAAVQSVEVRARVSGHLESIHFAEGEDVARGDVLFVIDPRPFQASLQSAEAQLNRTRAEVKASESLLRQAEAEKAQADAALQLARQREGRASKLLEQNAISDEEYDQRASERSQANADVEAAVASIEAARANIETARAAVVVAEAAVDSAKLELEYCEIRSPIAGRIGNRLITVGNLINGGSSQASLLTTIVSLDPIHAYFDANEREVLNYMRMVSAGQRENSRSGDVRNPVFMKLADENGYPHRGHIDFVDNRIDPNTGTMRARAIFPNPDRLLTPGMFAEVRLPGDLRGEAILIPDAAVGSDQSETFVYVVDESDEVQRSRVELGSMHQGLRIVREGLAADQRLVVSGLQMIRQGMKVRVREGEEIEREESGDLPNEVEPVPRSEWLSVDLNRDSGDVAKRREVTPKRSR